MDMKINTPLIRSEREKRAWTQQQLADIADLSLRTVQRMETTGRGGAESVKAVASAFDLETARLLLEPGTPEERSKNVESRHSGFWVKSSTIAVTLLVSVALPVFLFHASTAIGDADYYRFEGGIRINDGQSHEFGIDVKSDQVFILDIDSRHKLLFEAPAGTGAERQTIVRLLQNDGRAYNTMHKSARPGQIDSAHSVSYRVCADNVVFYAPAVKHVPGCSESFTGVSR